MKRFRYIPFVLLIILTAIIGTAVAETNEPEAVDSLSNWDNAKRLTNSTNAPNGAQRPIFAVAPNNTIIVAYMLQRSDNELDADPYYRKSPDGGDTWTAPASIHTSADFSRQVHVAFDNNNDAHAVWTEDDNQLWYGNEDDWPSNGSAQLFSTADILIESPKIAVDANGVIHIVWSQVDFTGQDLYYSRSTTGGDSWSTPENVSNSDASSESPSLAIDSNNRAHVVWEEQVVGSEYRISYSLRSGGSWSTPRGISKIVPGITSAREPDIAIRGSRVLVVFEDRVSLGQQFLYSLECNMPCTANPLTSGKWHYRTATVQAFGAKDSDPTFLGPKISSVGRCRVIVFSGITGNTTTNNEKVRVANSCTGFSSNPVIEAIEDSLGDTDRAIKPSIAVANNWTVYVGYELKSSDRSDIFYVKNQPGVYLPVVIKD
ncbi:hypothetical protein [Candidatus Leptofilum sp.]|uniref:hypothetical protein n=1 Tax=Candidatus Leptofilum sp. TaxID=3241576 RepID=UPI003B5C7139